MFTGLCVCILFKFIASVSNAWTKTAIWHKKCSPDGVGQQWAKDDGETIEELSTGQLQQDGSP